MNTPEQTPGAPAEPSDCLLLRRLRQGSPDAAVQLYRRYVRRVRALARAQCSADLAPRLDCEDIVQSVFGSFFRGACRGYYRVAEGERLWGLLLVIALNQIRAEGNYHRAAKRDVRRTVGGECLEGLPEVGQGPQERALLGLAIAEALDRLPPYPRQVVTLRSEGYEVAEIARKTGRPVRTVERTFQQAREQLSELIRDD
jgi:RNA polymerase sigma-70 factor (ECF subfamily)